MIDHIVSRKERMISLIGVVALLVSYGAYSLIPMADTWFYAGVFLLISFVAVGVFLLIVGRSRSRRPGVPTNTQLQQTPPAIIQRVHDDRT